jgi:hypothetical protein
MEMHRKRHMVNLWSGIELVLFTIRKMSAFYIHISAATQLPALLPAMTPALLPATTPALLPVMTPALLPVMWRY